MTQLTRAVQANFARYFEPFGALENSRFCEEADVTWFATRHAPGSFVLQTRFSSADAERRIDETLTSCARLTRQVGWRVQQHDGPADLGRRLERYGLERGEPERFYVRALDDLPAQPLPADFEIVRVMSDDQMRTWRLATAAGFQSPLDFATIYSEAYRLAGYSGRHIHTLGLYQGQAVTSATLLLDGTIAGVYNVSTDPGFRRMGFASAITLCALHDAAERGYRHAMLSASEMARSLYERLGFQVLLEQEEYVWRA